MPEEAGAAEFRGEVAEELETALQKFGISGLGASNGSLQTGAGGPLPFEWRDGGQVVEVEVRRAPSGVDG